MSTEVLERRSETVFRVGDIVTTIEERVGTRNYRTKPGEEYVVKKVTATKVQLRGPWSWAPNYGFATGTDWAFITRVVPLDPNAPRPRRLGEAPEGGIPIDDPRIAWIFDDAALVADMEGFCSHFDKIADALGAPGREREFTVTVKLSADLEGKVKTKARSRILAEKAVAAETGLEVVTR